MGADGTTPEGVDPRRGGQETVMIQARHLRWERRAKRDDRYRMAMLHDPIMTRLAGIAIDGSGECDRRAVMYMFVVAVAKLQDQRHGVKHTEGDTQGMALGHATNKSSYVASANHARMPLIHRLR